jgi:predicted permease
MTPPPRLPGTGNHESNDSFDRPPRPAVWLLNLFIDADRREALLGDLEELHAVRAAGAGPADARRWYWRQAVTAILEALSQRRQQPAAPHGDSLMKTIGQDLRLALRGVVSQPGFTMVAVLMLAIGVGANVTIFSWVNSVLLNPLPGASRPSELVQFSYLFRGNPLTSFSYPDYRRIRDASTLTTGVIARDDLSVGIVIDREGERAWAEPVSANFFDVLGVGAVQGRLFGAADDVPGAPAVAVINHAYWVGRFAADPAVVGRQVRINGQPFTIVGVAQRGFAGGESGLRFDLWIPMGATPLVVPGGSRLEVRGSRWLSVLARRMPDVSVDQVRAELESTVTALRAEHPSYTDHSAAVYPLSQSPTGGVSVLRPVLLILMTVAVIVLLIACANLAGLLLARASARQREIAIRLSMGARRTRIVQQLLVEGAVLSVIGTAAAMLVLQWTSGLLIGFAPPSDLPISLEVAIDGRVVAFAAAMGILTTLLCALAPAVQASAADLAVSLRDAGLAGRASGRHRLRRGLVAAQVALSITLLVGAGLCIRSLGAAAMMTPGFNADGVVVGWLNVVAAGYGPQEGLAFYTRVLDRVRELPGVESASLARAIPLGFSGGSFSDVSVEGYERHGDEWMGVGINHVGPDYMRTMQIDLVDGRDVSAEDVAGRPRVAIVSESMARKFWKGRNPIGGRFVFGRITENLADRWFTVVGVVRDVKQRSYAETPQPFVYIPVMQAYQPQLVLHARTASSGAAIAPSLRQIVREIDPRVPFYNLGLLADHARAGTFQQQLAADLLVVFGALALMLAGVGSYGVLSYLVGLRRREIGIRLAVGATRADVFRLVCGSGARLMATGLAAGLLLSAGVGMGLRSLLIGISPADPVTYAGVLAVLTAVAAAACLLPARRAASVDPVKTLREE